MLPSFYQSERFMKFIAVFFAIISMSLAPLQAAKKPTTSTKKPATTTKKATPSRPSSPAKPETPGVFRPFEENDPSVFPGSSADVVVVCDAVTGRVLYERNAYETRAVASTQKLLTALIVAEDGDLYSHLTTEAIDGKCEPTKLGIKGGERYRRYDLLRLLIVKSMNDVARCLARDNAGSVAAFAKKMNTKARELGMRNSNFVNPNGLTEPGQFSTGHDMARLSLHAYRNRVLRGIMATRQMTFTNADGKTTTYDNSNKLMKYFGLCNGMKTGYTEAAGHCLISSATEGERHVICVILGVRKRDNLWTDSHRLLSWGLHQLKQ
jgi:serine-type D-Ala-D-Ala carboxypeptidase (penicillin-binding protein 5/6)